MFIPIHLVDLNTIAQDINYIDSDESLYDSDLTSPYSPADDFINDVLSEIQA